ncbi:hypothetical protein FSP39_007656 [Pinctada imbricata]|uniref:Uncharacterized protein n=1 Tax=Pinctada imbricata TaxID=66713 RepID=A0AA88YCZ9_PINIB|nr:hypothetical protein FSP39_007656 [Pinctada imbricata]
MQQQSNRSENAENTYKARNTKGARNTNKTSKHQTQKITHKVYPNKFTGTFALTLRLVDLTAIATDFEISQGFKTLWRSHFWQSFLASDVVLTFNHIVTIIFSLYMILQLTARHFVMYMQTHKIYIIWFCIYIFVELSFSLFEYSFYAMNTFRLSFVVFTWLFWVFRTLCNVVFVAVLIARRQEMKEQMDYELMFAGEKRRGL